VKAVVFAGDGRVEIDDVVEPRVQEPADATVRVTRTSICGSDLHVLDGKTPGMRIGGVIGHEFVGVVSDAGPDVRTHREGGRVLGSFLIACGRCGSCRARRFNFCFDRRSLGTGSLTGDLDGAQAEYVRVPDADVNLHSLDGTFAALDDEEALFAGDILATGVYAADLAGAAASMRTVVIGAGPVGLFCALAARRRGTRVFVLDSDAERVRFATETLGLDAAVPDDSAEDTVAKFFDNEQADAVMEAVGAAAAFRSAMRCVRDGGRVVVVGVYGAERFDLPMGMSWVRGLQIVFSGMSNVQAHWAESLHAVMKGEIEPTKLITHHLPLDEAPEGYDLFRSRRAIKVVLTP
jgi:threonine dehydrogenase-like Zn-dependent dehydrogenase